MAAPLKVLSSMATREVLGELVRDFAATAACPVDLESVGGVDAAKRIRAGERCDIVVLAGEVIDALAAEGRVVPGSRVDVARSAIAAAVRTSAARPDIGSEEALRRAVLVAPSIGYSTGPSGAHLETLFARWGIAEAVRERIVRAPPGVPVGALVAKGEVALGFQQLAELVHQAGIEVLGPLPDAVQAITTFAGGVAAVCERPQEARALLAFLAGPQAASAKRRHGMAPA